MKKYWTVKWKYGSFEYIKRIPITDIIDDDNWFSHNVDDDTAFEVNIFAEDEKFKVSVFKLDPQKKIEGIWTMDNMGAVGGEFLK